MRYMEGVNRNINEQAIQLRIEIEQAKLNRDLSDKEKQEIINTQLARPGSQFGGRVTGVRGTTATAADGEKGNQRAIDEEESSEYSSDWDDWQDPDYIEEQRKALQEFSKKQREIR